VCPGGQTWSLGRFIALTDLKVIALVALSFLGHATALIDVMGVKVLTDPVVRSRLMFLRRVGPPVPPAVYDGVDVVVISHLHHDHCDLPSLAKLGGDPWIIVPSGGVNLLGGKGFEKVVALRPGQSHRIGPVTLTATPAVHDGMRKPFGPRAAAIGYLITSLDSTVYFAGDTDLFPAMRDLSPHIDLALLPVWGWGPNLGPGHLDPARAAQAVELLQPRRAVPIHWGTFFPYGLRPFYADRLRLPPHEFASAVGTGGRTEVLVLSPGGGPVWLT
jgi:L-ascorbate metabolism protein UlaG (beta-lactamase superfamily)